MSQLKIPLVSVPDAVLRDVSETSPTPLDCADFFCGIGGFHVAAESLGHRVVVACDIDAEARRAYAANFDVVPHGDICQLDENAVPDFDLLFAGFPCQPFSIIGKRRGFDDDRGTLFFQLSRFISAKLPRGIILENVKQLATAQGGLVLHRMMKELNHLGYHTDYRVLNTLDFGLPQKRERVYIAASLEPLHSFRWSSEPMPMTPLSSILESNPDSKHFASDEIRAKRHRMHTAASSPMIWHENKSGNISSYPWSCALRAGASYNYLLVDGKRRLTPRETLRLHGFPDSWKIVCSDTQTKKQTGNAVSVPVAKAVIRAMVEHLEKAKAETQQLSA